MIPISFSELSLQRSMSVLTRLCHLQICTALESFRSPSTRVRYMFQLTCANRKPFFFKLGSIAFLGLFLDIALVCERNCLYVNGFTIKQWRNRHQLKYRNKRVAFGEEYTIYREIWDNCLIQKCVWPFSAQLGGNYTRMVC